MSRKLKRLSGKEVLSILSKIGFLVHSQKGSHVKLRRIYSGEIQTLTIPLHDELDIGTCLLTPAIKYLKAVIPRLDRGIQNRIWMLRSSRSMTMFNLFNCRSNNREVQVK